MADKYLIFTPKNARQARRFIGKKGWLYSRSELVDRESHPLDCLITLGSVDLGSETPFSWKGNGGRISTVNNQPSFKYFVTGNPKRLLMQDGE